MRERSELPTDQPQMGVSTSRKGFDCCMMCMQICFDTHGDQGQAEAKELLAAPSFIKVILDSHLSRFLRVPTAFMEDHGYRIGDMVTLTGPMGYECQAPLVYEKGHGFPGGCASFLEYHCVEPGDYILFTLIADSNFLIKLYNKAGSEKTNFPANPSVTNYGGKAQTESIQEKRSISPNADFNHNRKHSKDVYYEKRLSGTSKSTVQCQARRKRKYKEDEEAVDVHDRGDTRHRKGDADGGVKKGTKRLTRKPGMENASNEDCHEKNMEEKKKQRSRVLSMLKRTSAGFPRSVRANFGDEQGPGDLSEQPQDWRGRVSANDQRGSIKWVDAHHSHANLEASNGREERDMPTEYVVGSVTNFQRGCTSECEEFAEGVELNITPGQQSPVHYHDCPGENEQHAASDSARISKEAEQEPMDIDTAENNRTTKVRQGLILEHDLINVPDLNRGRILREASNELLYASDSLKTNNPRTRLVIRGRTNSFKSFPASFSSKWFPKSKATVTLTNRAGKQWPVTWNPGNKRSRLTGGWKTFAKENSLKEGDGCILELINPGRLELLVQIFRSGDFPHEIASHGGDRGGTQVVEHIIHQAMKQGELSRKGWRSQGDIEANQRTTSNGCKVAKRMTFSSDSGKFKYHSEDKRMMSKVDTQMLLPTAAQFFAGMKQPAVPGAEGKVVGDGRTRIEHDPKVSRRKEQVTAALQASARVRVKRALVAKQKSLGNGRGHGLDVAKAMRLKNPHVAVVMRVSHVLSGFTVFLPVSLRMPWRTTTLTLLDTAGKSCRATWVVTSSGKRLSAGWRRFALDHKLVVGDVCIFEVTNFDDLTLLVHVFRGRTDVKCNDPSTDVPSRGNLLSVDQRMKSRSVVPKSGKSGVAFVSHRRAVTRTERERAKQEAQAEALKSKNPTAVVVMRHSSVYQYFIVSIPIKFAKKWLPRRLVRVSLQDTTGLSWTATWAGNAKRTPCLKGWRAFSLNHCLEEGDVCVFELTNPMELKFSVHIFRVLALNIRGSEAYTWQDHYSSTSTKSPGHSKYHLQVRKSIQSELANNPQNSQSVEDIVHKVAEAEGLPLRCPKNRLFEVIRASNRKRLMERRAKIGLREAQPDEATTEAMAGETVVLAGPSSFHRSPELSTDFLQREDEPVILKMVKSEPVVDSFLLAGCNCAPPRGNIPQVRRDSPFNLKAPKTEILIEAYASDACPLGPQLLDSVMGVFLETTAPWQKEITEVGRDMGGSGREGVEMDAEGSERAGATSEMHLSSFSDVFAGYNRISSQGDIPQIRRDSPFNLIAPKTEILTEANASDACPLGPQLLDSAMGVFSETTAPLQNEINEVGKDKGGSVREDVEMDAEGSETVGATSEMHLSSFSDVFAGYNRISSQGDIPQIRRDSPFNLKAPKTEILTEANASDACPLGPQLLDSAMGVFSETTAPLQNEINEVGKDKGGSVREDVEMDAEGSETVGATSEMHLSSFSDVSAGFNRASPRGDIPKSKRHSPFILKAPKREILIEANASDACPLGPQLLHSIIGVFSETTAPWEKEIKEVGKKKGGSTREHVEMDAEGSERAGATSEMLLSSFSDVSAKIEPAEDS